MRRWLVLLGLTAWTVALAAPLLWPGDSEKPGKFYALGHWFDRRYEIQLPLALVGALAIAVAILRTSDRSRPTD